MRSHPIAAHEESGRYIVLREHGNNASIEPGWQIWFLAQVECQRDVRLVPIPVIDKVDIGMRQGRRDARSGARRFSGSR